MDRLDIVAVGIEQEGAVVARAVRAFTGRAIVTAAGGKTRAIEAIDGFAIRSLKRQVNLVRRGRRTASEFSVADEELVPCEGVFPERLDFDPQDFEHGAIETFALVEIGNDQVKMIDQSATVELHSREDRSPLWNR